MKTLPHPHAQPLLPRHGAPELLFLLFHGAGSTAEQMRPLAHALHREFEQAAVVALDAPQALPGGVVHGYRWFDEQDGEAGLQAAMPGFVATVRAWMDYFALPWPRVALAGFSQGGLMALEAVQQQPQLAGRVLSFGAAPLARPTVAPEGVCLHLLHGLMDEVVPYAHLVDAARTWVGLGADVTADVLPEVGHLLDEQLIARGLHQLRTFIPARLWREAVQQAAEMDEADRVALQRPH
jgi:phospholipase/carboxylesterase